MFDKNILVFTRKKFSAKDLIKLLDRMFIFKSEHWKETILEKEKEKHKYHFCIRIDVSNLKMDLNEKQKPTVRKINIEVWDRDDNDGTDFLLELFLE